jgi:hypothetical protein
MNRRATFIIFAIGLLIPVLPVLGQGGAEDLPLADQKALQASRKTPEQQAPPSDQQAAPVGQQTSPAAQNAPAGDRTAPQAAQQVPQPERKGARPEGYVPEGKALVYIYSVGFTGNVSTTEALLLGKTGPIGIIRPLSYYSLVIEPGTTRLWLIAARTRQLEFEAAAGEVYYVKAGVSASVMAGAPELELIPTDTAMKEIAQCQPID